MNYPDVKFSCPHCNVTLKMREDADVLTGPCPKCGKAITAPDLKEEFLKKVKAKSPVAPTVSPKLRSELLSEKPTDLVSVETPQPEKSRSLFAILLPLLLIALLFGLGYLVVKLTKGTKGRPQNFVPPAQSVPINHEKEVTHFEKKENNGKPVISNIAIPPVPKPSPSIPENPQNKKPAPESKQPQFFHDPQDLSSPGEIPSSSAVVHSESAICDTGEKPATGLSI